MPYSIATDVEGNAVAKFGTRTITFYPLTLKMVQQSAALIRELRQTPDENADDPRWAKIIEILTQSAQRGEPTVKAEDVEAVVDLRNWKTVLDTVLGNSGLQAVSDGAAARPPASGAQPTGTASTQA